MAIVWQVFFFFFLQPVYCWGWSPVWYMKVKEDTVKVKEIPFTSMQSVQQKRTENKWYTKQQFLKKTAKCTFGFLLFWPYPVIYELFDPLL